MIFVCFSEVFRSFFTDFRILVRVASFLYFIFFVFCGLRFAFFRSFGGYLYGVVPKLFFSFSYRYILSCIIMAFAFVVRCLNYAMVDGSLFVLVAVVPCFVFCSLPWFGLRTNLVTFKRRDLSEWPRLV